MSSEIVVLLGDVRIESQALDSLVEEFGWSLKKVQDVHGLAQPNFDNNLIAVLFDPKSLSLPWDRALRVILEAAPRALPILFHRFAEAIDWPQVADAGAFHSLQLPLNQCEARQTLGFVWSARRRSTAVSMACHPDLEPADSRQTQQFGARVARAAA